MNIVRMKKMKTGKTKVNYSEGYFGGLFGMTGIWIDEMQLKQWFGGRVPDEFDLALIPVEHDEKEEIDRELRNRTLKAQRARRAEDKAESEKILGGMQVREALERLAKKRKSS